MSAPVAGIPNSARSSENPEDQALSVVLGSSALQRAPALRRLLAYLWEHRHDAPGEYAIALDVLGKRADFDPKIDATVRVHVARLRLKLKEFFETEGLDLPVHFVIPAGSYKLEVRRNSTPQAGPVADSPRKPAPALLVACLVSVVLAATAGLLWRENQRLQNLAVSTQAAAELPRFWRHLLGNGKLTRIVIPTPVFFQIGRLRVRDVRLSDPNDTSLSDLLPRLEREFGKASLSQSYSVTTDSLALATLTRLLAVGGVPLATGVTKDLSLELFGSDNLVFLGIPPTSPHIGQLLARTEFYLKPDTQAVGIRRPHAGEPAEFRADSKERIRYGIVSALPGQSAGTRLILLSGSQTSSLAAYLASPVTLRQLEAFLTKQGNPEYFEMVVATESDGFNLQKASVAAFRPVPVNLWK
jgi:hypothetical protein